MQFTHSRLLITSSLPLRFSSGFPFFRRFPAGSLFFSGSPPVLCSSPLVFRFSAGSSVFPFFAGSPPFPRYRSRLGAPPEGAAGAVTEGETAEAWEEGDAGDVVEGDAGGQSGGRCGGLRRAVPHFGVFRVQLWRKSFEWADFQQSCTAFRTKYGTARPGMHRYDLFYIHLQKTS